MPRSLRQPGCDSRRQHHRAGAVAEEDAGARGRSSRGCARRSRRRSPAPASPARRWIIASAVVSAKTKPEQTAWMSKAAPCCMPSLFWTLTAAAGKVLSGVAVASTIRSMSAGVSPALSSAAFAASSAEVGGELAIGGDVALADAGPLQDPLVGRLDHPRQVGVGEDLLGQVAARPEDHRTDRAHSASAGAASASRMAGCAR